MRINIERNEQNLKLLTSLASKNKAEREFAHESMASFMGPVLQEVINNAPTLSNFWRTMEFLENSNPSLPLDLYIDVGEEDFIQVWSQAEAGGLPFNQPTPPTQELKFTTYRLDSAIAFNQKYARESRLDVVGKSMTRLAQEVMLKQERNAAGLLLRAAAQAQTEIRGAATPHIIRSHRAGEFLLEDFNRLFTLIKRIYSAWNGGTPVGGTPRGLTHLVISPEIVEYLRGMAYNPINTRAGVLSGDPAAGVASTAIPLTDSVREQIHNSAGAPEFFGVKLFEFHEFGVGYKYNDLFKYFAGSTLFPDNPSTAGSAKAFDATEEQLLLGLNLNSDSLVRPVSVDTDTNAQFNVEADDQFVKRSAKIGFYGALEEGRLILDDRVITGIIV